MEVLGPRRAGLLHQGAKHAVVAGQRPGVGRRGASAGLRRPNLQHRYTDPALRANGERLGEGGPVVVVLEEERQRADALPLGHGGDPVARGAHGLVARGHDGVPADPPARAECVHPDVAALGHHRHRPGLERGQAVAPEHRPGPDDDHAVAVRPADGQPVLACDPGQLGLVRAAGLDLGEACRQHHGTAASPLGASPDDLGHARGRDRDHEGVDRLGQVGDASARTRARGPPRASG